jgi:hypothetical protein
MHIWNTNKHYSSLQLPKFELGAANAQYPKFRLKPEGILPDLDKLKAVKNTDVPKVVGEVRQFTGICNFFRS